MIIGVVVPDEPKEMIQHASRVLKWAGRMYESWGDCPLQAKEAYDFSSALQNYAESLE